MVLSRSAGGWVGGGGWVAGLTETKTKPNPKLKLELKFGAELCNNHRKDPFNNEQTYKKGPG